MKDIILSEDVVPIGEFKAQTAQWIKKVNETGHPVMITQNGKAAGVMVSPKDYDEILEQQRLFIAVAKGMNDVESGKTCTTEELLKSLGLEDR